MKNNFKKLGFILLLFSGISFTTVSCGGGESGTTDQEHHDHNHEHEGDHGHEH